jgi:hypothetical protein
MGIRIGENQKTEITVRKHGTGYYTTVARKLEDGTYDNAFVSVSFRKGVELEDRTRIKVNDGFLSFWRKTPETKEMITITRKDGTTEEVEKKGDPIYTFMILDYEVLHKYDRTDLKQEEEKEEYTPVSDDELPF